VCMCVCVCVCVCASVCICVSVFLCICVNVCEGVLEHTYPSTHAVGVHFGQSATAERAAVLLHVIVRLQRGKKSIRLTILAATLHLVCDCAPTILAATLHLSITLPITNEPLTITLHLTILAATLHLSITLPITNEPFTITLPITNEPLTITLYIKPFWLLRYI